MRRSRSLQVAAALIPLLAGSLAAQGAGTSGSEISQLPAGARAAALAGAYSAASEDANVIFYNPAGVSSLFRAAGLTYQRHVVDVSIGSLAGAVRLGRVSIGAGIAYLDAGDIREIGCVPEFPTCERGDTTGRTVGATESASRLAVATPVLNGVLHVGGAIGLATSDLAGVSRSAAFVDLGARFDAARHFDLPNPLALGLSFRNLGPSLSGEGIADAPLPSEARLGAMGIYRWQAELGVLATADVVSRLKEETTGAVLGIEAGLMPADPARPGAVVRVGYDGTRGDGGVGALRLGAGLSLSGFALDYSYEDLDFLGSAHRFGVRWMMAR